MLRESETLQKYSMLPLKVNCSSPDGILNFIEFNIEMCGVPFSSNITCSGFSSELLRTEPTHHQFLLLVKRVECRRYCLADFLGQVFTQTLVASHVEEKTSADVELVVE